MQTGEGGKGENIAQIGAMLHTEFILKIFALATCSFVVTIRYFF